MHKMRITPERLLRSPTRWGRLERIPGVRVGPGLR